MTGTLVAFEAFLPLLLLSLRRADWLPDLGLREGEILGEREEKDRDEEKINEKNRDGEKTIEGYYRGGKRR